MFTYPFLGGSNILDFNQTSDESWGDCISRQYSTNSRKFGLSKEFIVAKKFCKKSHCGLF